MEYHFCCWIMWEMDKRLGYGCHGDRSCVSFIRQWYPYLMNKYTKVRLNRRIHNRKDSHIHLHQSQRILKTCQAKKHLSCTQVASFRWITRVLHWHVANAISVMGTKNCDPEKVENVTLPESTWRWPWGLMGHSWSESWRMSENFPGVKTEEWA